MEIATPDKLMPFDSTVFLSNNPTIFLSGTIDMGEGEDWQKRIINRLKDIGYLNILNPRRDGWDSSWKQDLNSANFYEQVTWELDALEYASIIAMYFANGSKSPISLLELGLYANTGKLVVYCNDFYRKGNVDIVCQRYGVPVFSDEDAWVSEIKRQIIQSGCSK